MKKFFIKGMLGSFSSSVPKFFKLVHVFICMEDTCCISSDLALGAAVRAKQSVRMMIQLFPASCRKTDFLSFHVLWSRYRILSITKSTTWYEAKNNLFVCFFFTYDTLKNIFIHCASDSSIKDMFSTEQGVFSVSYLNITVSGICLPLVLQ